MSVNLDMRSPVYVIQRESESRCEWWTGSNWSEDKDAALRFSTEPSPGEVTGDEAAKAELLES